MAEATVDTPGTNQEIMAERLAPINGLLAGTAVLRECGEEFLPRYDQESDRVYGARLARAVLFNVFKESSAAMSGRPFRTPVKVSEQSPLIDDYLDDVDMLGQDLTAFLHEAFELSLRKGYSAILVDHPSDSGATTLQEERDMGLRPYLKLLSPECFVAGYATIEGGREVVTHLRIREQVTVREGFGEALQDRIRVFDRSPEGFVTWQLWELRQQTKRHRAVWVPITDPVLTTMTEIPLVVFYAGQREDFLLAEPPLTDLAYLNLQHWQSYSDQIHVLTVARFPILAVKGTDDDDTVVVGPNKIMKTRDPNSLVYYVEHSGAAIGAGRQDLLDLETRMAALGVDLLIRPSGRATATGKSIDEAQSGSALQSLAMRFQDVATRAVRMMEKWRGVEKPAAVVEVNADFGLTMKDQADLQFLLQLRAIKDISREAILKEAKRRNILPEVFNLIMNAAQLEAETDADMLLLDAESESEEIQDEEDEGTDGDE